MLVFGIDLPLVELILALLIILIILFIEALIVMAILLKQVSKNTTLSENMEKMSKYLLDLKNQELAEMDKIHKKRD